MASPASGISRGMRCFVGFIMLALRGLLDLPRWAGERGKRGGGGGEKPGRRELLG